MPTHFLSRVVTRLEASSFGSKRMRVMSRINRDGGFPYMPFEWIQFVAAAWASGKARLRSRSFSVRSARVCCVTVAETVVEVAGAVPTGVGLHSACLVQLVSSLLPKNASRRMS